MTTARYLLRRLFLLALVGCSGAEICGQGVFSVVSTNDGNGQFSWTFSSTGGSSPDVDHFQMRLYGVQETFSPQGWTGTIDAGDVVTWSYVGGGGTPFNGSPITLSIRSSSIEAIVYGGIGNSTYPDGLYWGNLVAGRFVYEGPIQIPEPSPGTLWM